MQFRLKQPGDTWQMLYEFAFRIFKKHRISPQDISQLESTDNKIFYRPLFFPTVFINNEFIFETFIIKGILVMDIPTMEDLLIYTLTMDTETNAKTYHG